MVMFVVATINRHNDCCGERVPSIKTAKAADATKDEVLDENLNQVPRTLHSRECYQMFWFVPVDCHDVPSMFRQLSVLQFLNYSALLHFETCLNTL